MIRHHALGAVGVITVDREERRNALDVEHCGSLADMIRTTVRDGARAVVITGAGTCFCSGADFSEVARSDFRDQLYGMLSSILSAPIPVIAAVNGPAIGAGMQLALACDLRVAVPEASFALPTAQLALAVDVWTIRTLTDIVGEGIARSVLLGCEYLDSNKALQCGLVNRIDTVGGALGWADEIARFAPLTLSYYKQVMANKPANLSADQILSEAFDALWASEDLREGQIARRENRAPSFRGR